MSTKSAKREYDNDSISALKGAERVRRRPSVIFGSDGLDACEHSAFEIVSNSIDEAREGHGDTIIVTLYEDHSIEVEDFGRGCPVDYNEKEQRYNWELVFCELYAGGKMNNNNDDSNYGFALGLNGLGACATQYTSEYMDVNVWRDGNKYTLHFEKGENIGGLKTEPADRKKTGSRIRWKPDLEVFTDINIPAEYFLDTLKRQSVVNAGITFKFRLQRGGSFETTEFRYENGIVDYLEELAGDKPTLTKPQFWTCERKGRDRDDRPEYKLKISAAFCFTNTAAKIEYYHNSSWLEYGGAPDKAVRNAFVYAIDNFAKQNGKYQKNESKINFADIMDCLLFVSNNFSTIASYENQTKKAVTNKFIQEAMTEFLRAQLEIYFIENKDEAMRICDQVLVNKRSRESAEKERLNIKKKLSGNLDITSRIQKFIDCRTKDRERRELYIVEGDSAAGACKQGRSAEFQAIMPVRGKILNCLKADFGKIFNSDIIVDLVKVLGCGVEVQSKKNKDLSSFDLAGLRWKRVIICTDADVDGFQIRTLILTMIYRLMPTLIKEGYVYIAESPLYEINSGNDTYFAYSDAEKNEIVEKLGKAKYTVQRSKGLGENEPDMMWETTMNPESRRLIKVVPDMAEAAVAEMFDLLLGDNLAARKTFIAENGWKYLDEADVS
ncbi:MAG: DNA topoisomerase [Oscillospiraceae bacterium]|nr:DNA topoisomerase [Oscillospiraceae bacterium]